MSEFDSPWKEVLDRYFEAFMAFFFPQAHAEIDWARGYEFLDKELQKIIREAEVTKRLVDKLVKVWLKNGQEAWVLIHIEVQGQHETEFERRMYVYNYRLFDRYNRKVATLVILTDERKDWRPSSHSYNLFGCTVGITFPAVKLIDFAAAEAALEANPNPFATVALAHLKTLQTRGKPDERRAWKFRLVKGLYERGLSAEDVRQLFRIIDWMMDLPRPLEALFQQE